MTVIIMLEIVARNRGLVVLPEDLEFHSSGCDLWRTLVANADRTKYIA